MNPAYTEGYEGFYHLTHMQGECEQAELTYIIRNHDAEQFEEQKQFMIRVCEYLNSRYGEGTFDLQITDQYRNMRSIIEKDMRVVELANQAIRLPADAAFIAGTRGNGWSFLDLYGTSLSELRHRQL